MYQFVREVSNGKEVPYYTNLFKTDANNLLKVTQYLVQESLLGGLFMTRPY